MAALIVILILLALTAALGFGLAAYSMRIKRQSLDESWEWQEAHYDISWYDSLQKQDYTVACDDGYILHAQRLVNPATSGRFMVISHGYTDNRFGALKYAKIYLDLGFDVIIYDLRGHGLNDETFCTYSARESKDLDALIRDARRRFDVRFMGLHGESLGAATTVAVLRYAPAVDFAVADCGFADITDILKAGLKGFHMPGWLVYPASMCAKIRYGYSYADMRPVDALAGNDIPIMFIHGADDGFIPPVHSERMAKAARGVRELHLIPGAKHAKSVFIAPDEYRRYVAAFIEKVERAPARDRLGSDREA